jgi:hypothetical protein
MTYAVGSIIRAADFNGLVGTTPVNTAYPDDATAQNHIAALIGVGYGNRGYGQTATILGNVSPAAIISSTQWNNLRNAMDVLNTHTGSNLTLQPLVNRGDVIRANDGSSGRTNVPTLIVSLDTNRNLANLTQMTSSSALTSTRTTNWHGDIYHEFTVNYSTEDQARYYFNSGGEIRFSGSLTGTSGSSLDQAWSALLSEMMTIKFGALNTTYTGTGGTIPTNIGYYGLSGSYQTIFNHYGSGGAYGVAGIYYRIDARRESYGGSNGGNGSLLRFRVTFSDTAAYHYHYHYHYNYHYHYGSVDGTLTSQIDQYKAGGVLTVVSPSFSTITGL